VNKTNILDNKIIKENKESQHLNEENKEYIRNNETDIENNKENKENNIKKTNIDPADKIKKALLITKYSNFVTFDNSMTTNNSKIDTSIDNESLSRPSKPNSKENHSEFSEVKKSFLSDRKEDSIGLAASIIDEDSEDTDNEITAKRQTVFEEYVELEPVRQLSNDIIIYLLTLT